MKQVVKETEVSGVRYRIDLFRNIANALFGLIEFILLARLIMKFFGASVNNAFVSFTYNITEWLIKPFEGIINNLNIVTTNNKLMFESATIISMIIIGVIALIIATIFSRTIVNRQIKTKESTSTTKSSDENF